jgi:L,D-transpeptidase ErfK/SrfK
MVIYFSSLNTIGTKARGRSFGRQPWTIICHFIWLSTCILCLHGCGATGNFLDRLTFTGQWWERIEGNYFLVKEQDDVIGRLAVIRLKKGDTLQDIARHFSLGINTVSSANPGVDIWVPGGDTRIVLPLSFILPEAYRAGIVINLAAMRLFYFKKEGDLQAVSTFPVGIGTAERPTPMGRMYITRKKFRPTWYVPASIASEHFEKGDPLPATVPPGPLNPLGEHALYLNKPGYLVHGTNKPASVGLRATNGCIRLYPEDIKRLYDTTPLQTPVKIVNQPYLVGQRDGIIYLEAHAPFDVSDSTTLEKAYAKLEQSEGRAGVVLDWNKIKKVVTEASGIPVAVSVTDPGGNTAVKEAIRIRHPAKLYGQPQVPEFTDDAWYVLAADFADAIDARRLAAIINHQGPPIPARAQSNGDRHRVLAGPFDSKDEAAAAAKRLRIDLEIRGMVVAPGKLKQPQS